LDDLVIEGADHAGFEHLDGRHAPLGHHAAKAKPHAAHHANAIESAAQKITKPEAAERKQLGLGKFTSLEKRVQSQMVEKIARHRVELGLAGRRDDHAEVLGAPLELRLDGEGFELTDRIPGYEGFLSRLKDVGVLSCEIAARRIQCLDSP